MAKVAVGAQKRTEQLPASAKANAANPTLILAQLQSYLIELNEVEAALNQAKLTLKAPTQLRDADPKEAPGTVVKAELAVKSQYGPKSPKVKEHVMTQPRAKKLAAK